MKKEIKDYILITLGTAIAALGMAIFLVPNKIAPGGVSGLSTILHYVLGLPVGALMLAINIILFLLAFRSLGKKFAIKTLYATVIFSVLVDVLQFPALQIDLFLSGVYGGVLMGIGIGIVFRANASTGGTDLLANMLHKKFRFIRTNWLLFGLDFIVVMLAAILFDTSLALYALVTVFLTSKIVEIISDGFRSTMAFFVISSQPNKIAHRVMEEMQRGVTTLSGKGMYSDEERVVLFCVLEGQHEVVAFKRIVKEVDEKAFVIMSAAREVMGEGFQRLTEEK